MGLADRRMEAQFAKSETFRDAESKLWQQFPPPNCNPELTKNSEQSRIWTHPSERCIDIAQGQGALLWWTKAIRSRATSVKTTFIYKSHSVGEFNYKLVASSSRRSVGER